jgi:hypothetical protein
MRVIGRVWPQAAIVAVCVPKCGAAEQTELMRVVVTRIGPDGTMRRRMAGTAASGDAGPWQELIARARAVAPPYRPVPGGLVCHLRVDDQVVLVAGRDLSGPLYDLGRTRVMRAVRTRRSQRQADPAALISGAAWER